MIRRRPEPGVPDNPGAWLAGRGETSRDFPTAPGDAFKHLLIADFRLKAIWRRKIYAIEHASRPCFEQDALGRTEHQRLTGTDAAFQRRDEIGETGSGRQEFVRLGYADRLAFGIGIVEILCTIIHVIPQTSVR